MSPCWQEGFVLLFVQPPKRCLMTPLMSSLLSSPPSPPIIPSPLLFLRLSVQFEIFEPAESSTLFILLFIFHRCKDAISQNIKDAEIELLRREETNVMSVTGLLFSERLPKFVVLLLPKYNEVACIVIAFVYFTAA